MADTDSDSEIQFNIVNDMNEEGQGDVIRYSPVPMLNPDDPIDDDFQRETPLPDPVPVHVPDLQLPRGRRVRSRSRESFDPLYPHRSPDRLRNMPDGNDWFRLIF